MRPLTQADKVAAFRALRGTYTAQNSTQALPVTVRVHGASRRWVRCSGRPLPSGRLVNMLRAETSPRRGSCVSGGTAIPSRRFLGLTISR